MYARWRAPYFIAALEMRAEKSWHLLSALIGFKEAFARAIRYARGVPPRRYCTKRFPLASCRGLGFELLAQRWQKYQYMRSVQKADPDTNVPTPPKKINNSNIKDFYSGSVNLIFVGLRLPGC